MPMTVDSTRPVERRPSTGLWKPSDFRIFGWTAVCIMGFVSIGCRHESPSEKTAAKPSRDVTLIDHVDASANIPGSAASTRRVPGIVRWEVVPPLRQEVAIMETVFWEPADTDSLRSTIFSTPEIAGSRVLEIGTGSGLVSLCCLQAGAEHVVATDVNSNAIHNVRYNTVEAFGDENRLDARLVPRRSPGAWTVIKSDERFDFIISNPPWEDSQPKNVEEYALYDPEFLLLDSIVTGARQRLRPRGRMWLAYGCVTAIRRIEMLTRQEKLQYLQLDDRSLDELPEVFLPGMLIEIKVPADARD
jgi:release factor glutamine methyltransferase